MVSHSVNSKESNVVWCQCLFFGYDIAPDPSVSCSIVAENTEMFVRVNALDDLTFVSVFNVLIYIP